MRRIRYLLLCIVFAVYANAQTYNYRYWFDDNHKTMHRGVSGDRLHLDIDVSGLSESLHSLHVVMSENDTLPSTTKTQFFLKTMMRTETDNVRVVSFIDGNRYKEDIAVTGNVAMYDLDVTGIPEGLHHLSLLLATPNEGVTSLASAYFIRTGILSSLDEISCFYSLDGERTATRANEMQNGMYSLDLDVSSLDEGLHSIHYYTTDGKGAVSSIKTACFIRTLVDETTGLRCLYSIDGKNEYTEAGVIGRGEYKLDFDAAPLSDGVHTLNYFFVSEAGGTTDIKTAFFVRDHARGEGIVRYDYSVNSGEFSQTVTLDAPTDTLRLKELQLADYMVDRFVRKFRMKVYDANGGVAEDGISIAPMENEFCVDGIWYSITSLEDCDCKVIPACDIAYQGNILIPDTVEHNEIKWNVTAISDSAFTDCNRITSIVLPERIAFIGKDALKTGNLNMLVYVEGVGDGQGVGSREQGAGDLVRASGFIGNLVVDGKADWIVLHDGYDFSCPRPFVAERISYDREFTMHTGRGFTEGWETLALPFDVDYIWHKTKGGYIESFASLEQRGITEFDRYSDPKPFWLYELADTGFAAAEKIEAYKPYVISMPNNEEYIEALRLPGVVSFRGENVTVPVTAPSRSDGARRLVPTTVRVGAAENVWVLNSEVSEVSEISEGSEVSENFDYLPGSVFIRGLRDVQPFEAYLTAETTRAAIRLAELADETLAIKDATITSKPKVQNRFNLMGQPVDRHYKGIVIKKGGKTLRR